MNTQFNTEFLSQLGTADFESWILVQKAYRDECWNEAIMECGFNKNSGYVYIALENGICIASCFGQSVDYIVTDYETGEEYFEDSYDEAINKNEELNP
jgi:hypothetical protein